GLKDCLLQATEEVCGRTKGLTRHTGTWWWNQDVTKLVEEKRSRFKIWSQTRTETDRAAYCNARKIASKEIYKDQETERKKFAAKLSKEDMKGNLFRIAKQLVRSNKDVVGSGSVKDKEGNIAVDDSRIKQVWKEYFKKLLNEEFEWNKDLLEDASPTSGPAERITEEELHAAVAKTKVGKAAGPRGLVSEMLNASGETGISWLTDVFNAIVKEGRI